MSLRLTRREWLGAAAGGLVAARLAGAAPGEPLPAAFAVRNPGAHDYRAALEAIQAHALAELAATGLPGMSLALATADGFAATLSLGWADLAGRVAVAPDQLFEIGSISKSLAGLWLHAAADRGRVDLSAPAATLLPDLPLPPEPVTLAELLNHAAGLPDDAAPFPPVPGGRLWTGFAPGARFSYSNTGYELLGLVIDRVAGRPHALALAADILAPLGMAGATARILTADRARYAVGYQPLLADRPALTGAAWREAPWTEEDMAAGAVAAPATAMINYLSHIIDLGQGRGAPLMGDRAAARMLAADIAAPAFGARARYASGFATQTIDGRRLLHHTGGMLGFSSSFHVDAAAGVGGYAGVNAQLADYRPRRVSAYAVAALRAARAGRSPPPPPDARGFARIADPRRFAGRWLGPAGEAIEFFPAPGGLALAADGARGRVESAGERSLVTDHPARSLHPFDLEGGRLWWGGTPFARGRAPAAPAVPAALRPLEGRYVAHDPWSPSLRVFARGDRLWAEPIGEVVERPGGWWSAPDDPGGVDRLWFEAPVAGRPSRANRNGFAAQRIG